MKKNVQPVGCNLTGLMSKIGVPTCRNNKMVHSVRCVLSYMNSTLGIKLYLQRGKTSNGVNFLNRYSSQYTGIGVEKFIPP